MYLADDFWREEPTLDHKIAIKMRKEWVRVYVAVHGVPYPPVVVHTMDMHCLEKKRVLQKFDDEESKSSKLSTTFDTRDHV